MKKIVLGIFLLSVLAIGGTFLYVVSIDWNKHKDKISEQFYNSTGKHIVFVGDVGFKIFPTPYLKAVDAKVYNSENKNEKPLLDIKNINAELSLFPLLKGEVTVNKMTLDGVVVNIDWDNKGLNWQGDLSSDQRQMMRDTNMILNSVSLKNTTVNFEASGGDVNFSLQNLSGEVMAQSIFGPFRIEGNYLNDNTPHGFAVTIGKLEDTMPTSLNAVFTHPKSNSYVRFDGSFHLGNKVLNGNVVVESQKVGEFINDNFAKLELSENYNKPLVLGFDIALNKQMINLDNVVIKYEETQGAGSIKMPNTNLKNPNIRVKFEFADLDLTPAVDYVKYFVKKYSEETFTQETGVKLVADIKSLRASYDGQVFKNLDWSFEVNEKGFLLDELAIVLPGNSQFNLKGSVYPYDGEVYYQADVSLASEELMRLLKWIKLEPKAMASSVYKKMLLTSKIVGNFDKVQISPYKIILDNTSFSGDAGMVFGARKDVILNVKADTLNFDNYIKSIPDEIKAKNFAERLEYRFSKLGILNDFDMVLNTDVGLVFYEGLAFEDVKFKGNILQSVLEIDQAKVGNVANSLMEFKGKVTGFGGKPSFENFEYSIETKDVVNMIDKLGLYKPEFDYDRFYNLSAKGTLSGELDDFNINTNFSSGDLSVDYSGKVKLSDKAYFDGDADLKDSELVSFINGIGLNYRPRISKLGLFRLKSKIQGSLDNLNMTNMDLNAGYSQFSGDVSYDFRENKKIANATLKINKIELDKYLVKDTKKAPAEIKPDKIDASFLSKPLWGKDKINYSPYEELEVKGDFEIGELSYNNYKFKDARFKLDANDNLINVSDFVGVYKNTPVKLTSSLDVMNNQTFNVAIDVPEANALDFYLGGKTYSLREGMFSTKINITSKASSEEDFINNLNGTIDFQANNTNVSGFNIKNIYNDVITRNKSEGFVEFANSQIASGSSAFDKIVGKINITGGDFKITEGKMEAANTVVTVTGKGSLKDWIIDVLLDIKHAEPKHLQNYTISMKNAMDNPDVSIDISKLFNTFKAKEEEKEAEIKAQDEALKQQLLQQFNEQKKLAEDLIKSAKDKMSSDIDDKIKNSFSDDSIKMYEDLRNEVDMLRNSFLTNISLVNSDDITPEKINNLKDINTKAIQEFELLKDKGNQIYLTDLQKQNASEYENIIKINDDLKNIIADYNAKIASYNSRLANIITEYTLETDEKYVESKKQIDEVISNLKKMNNDVATAHNLYSANASIDDYQQLNVKMKEILEKSIAGKNEILQKIKSFEETIEASVSAEENLYHKKIEDEENQRLIEENTGSISIKKTGKKMTVKRALEDIKEAEEEISNDVVKVIDFTKKKTDTLMQPVEKTNGVIKKGRANY